MTPAREFLDRQDSRRDPEVFPMWDPQQLLAASRTLLLRSVVPQSVGEGSGSDETLSAADDSEYGSRCVCTYVRTLLGTLYAELSCDGWWCRVCGVGGVVCGG